MENKNTIFIATLISICVFCVFFAVFLFRHVKKVEFEFNEKEASLIKDSMDLRDLLEEVKITITEKTKEVSLVKKEKEKIIKQMKVIKEENDKLNKLYAEQIEALKKEDVTLRGELRALKELSLDELLRKALDAEEDENIKKVLERTLHNIELVRKGDLVDLEPIIVAQEGGEKVRKEAALPLQKEGGEILSVDRSNNLIVIDLGKRDKIKEGQHCAILADGEEIASGEIISARHRVSAAFIDDIKYRYTLSDVKKGSKVIVE